MLKSNKNGISLRIILLFMFSFFILLGFFYNYFEWNTIKTLANIYNENWSNEFEVVSSGEKISSDSATTLINLITLLGSDKAEFDDLIKQFDYSDSAINTQINYSENYLKTLEKNKNKLVLIQKVANLLIGERRNFSRDLIKLQNNYYNFEIEGANRSIVQYYLIRAYFRTYKDNVILNDYGNRIINNPQVNAQKYFYEISPLEKYAKSDFKIEKQDQIKKLFPNSYTGIEKSVNYSASYYSAMKDYISGDMESYSYKLTKLDQDALNLNFDFTILYKEGEDKSRDLTKSIIETVSKNIELIKNYREKKLGNYIYGNINNWQEDMVLCQLYDYKVGFVYSLTGKYLEAKNIKDLIKGLSETMPRTDYIDSKFDTKIMTFSNDNKSFNFGCKNTLTNKVYKFVINKN